MSYGVASLSVFSFDDLYEHIPFNNKKQITLQNLFLQLLITKLHEASHKVI